MATGVDVTFLAFMADMAARATATFLVFLAFVAAAAFIVGRELNNGDCLAIQSLPEDLHLSTTSRDDIRVIVWRYGVSRRSTYFHQRPGRQQ
jgi:hypothetical protein